MGSTPNQPLQGRAASGAPLNGNVMQPKDEHRTILDFF